MKITILGTAYPLRGGIAHYNALLASALGTAHTVNTVTFKRQYPAFLFPGKTQQESGETMIAPPAPQLVDSINPLNWVRVGRMIRDQRPDVLVFKYWLPFFGPCFGTIARIVRSNKHTRILCICDNVLPHERRPFDVSFTRYAFAAVDAFIVQSSAVERDLKQLLPRARYRHVPHPVYDIFGAAGDRYNARAALGITEERVILFFGYVRRYKGLHLLLQAMPHLLAHFPVRLLVVGEFYDEEQSYREQSRMLGIDHAVTFHSDYVPNDRVGVYFSAADLVILPYLSATQSGIAQIAYNFDRPVIATDVGGLAEIVIDGRTGYVVPPENPEMLAEAIARFYREKREQEFTNNVREEKRKYTWDTLVAAIQELGQMSG
jgi:glycosyltransferase involved in cell wall biosynthesis